MKTQRRQELKTNELSVYLRQLGEYVRANATSLTVVAVLLVALGVVVAYRSYSLTRSREQGWERYIAAARASVPPEPEPEGWADEVIGQWEHIVVSYDDPQIRALSARALTEFCLQRFVDATATERKQALLQKAERYCRLIMDEYQRERTLYAGALNSMAAIEENRFLLDGDLEHRTRARSFLERLRDEQVFTGTPFQTLALARLNEYDALWEPVVVVEAPEPPPPALPPPGPPAVEASPVEDDAPSPDEDLQAEELQDAPGGEAGAPEGDPGSAGEQPPE